MTDRPTHDTGPTTGRFDRVNTRLDGHPVWLWILVALVITTAVIGFGAWWTTRTAVPPSATAAMGGMTATGENPVPPPVTGYYNGQEILFIHTEASEPEVADMLTTMMGSPVLVVPQLAQVPDTVLAEVYVFTNGIQGEGPAGPFGYQADIFDSAPGDPTYSPLRRINLVTWKPDTTPRLLGSTDELAAAREAGELTITETETVVNMPMLTWPSGHR